MFYHGRILISSGTVFGGKVISPENHLSYRRENDKPEGRL
jgi:hypothetical protein